eukprot:s80_g5.t2
MFVTGVLLVICSTVALLMLHREEEEEEAPVDAEQVPLLHRNYNSEPTLKREPLPNEDQGGQDQFWEVDVEVHLKVAPPKRKRDLYKAAPAEEPPSTAPAAAPRNAAPDTAEDAELARALAEDSMSTSSSESDSSDSSSSGSSDEESLWETDFGLLPFATEAGGSQLAGEAQTASSSSSSSAMAPRAPRAPGSATVGGADGALVTLKGMGFDDLIATASLQAAGGNLEKAIIQESLFARKTAAEPRVVLVGVPLHRLSRNHQLPCLAVLVLTSSILAAALQERVLYVPGFRYTGWLAFLTSFTYMALAMVERVVERDLLRRGSLAEYVKLSFLTMGGMYFTNFSLHYLSYSLRVVFKSSKLVPVMLLGVVYLKKRYTVAQYVAVGLLTAGVVVFTLGDAKGRAFFNPVGIAFIVAGSLSDAMAANYEEKVFFSSRGPMEISLACNLRIVLPSGRYEIVAVPQDSRVFALKEAAQRALQQGFLRLVADDVRLDGMQTLEACGLRDGDSLTAVALPTRVAATERAFAMWCPGGDRIVTWGDPAYGGGSFEAHERFRTVQHVQATHRAFAAILGDGRVIAKGDAGYGGDSSRVQDRLRSVQKLVSTLRAFAAILENGSVVTWGHAEYGGDSSNIQNQLQEVRHVHSTDQAFAAILSTGRVVAWGLHQWGGDCATVQGLRDVKRLEATAGAFAALLSDGGVATWGHPDFGGDSAVVADLLTDVKEVKANMRAFAALLSTGSVITWGHPRYGGDSSEVQHLLIDVERIHPSKGGAFAAVLANGTVVTWGLSAYGGDSSAVQPLRNVLQVQATSGAFAATFSNGSIVTWGDSRYGGDSSGVYDRLRNVQQIHSTSRAFAAILMDGQVVTWGDFGFGGNCNRVREQFTLMMGCSASEVVLYSSALGSVWALLAEAFTAELLPALRHSWDHLEAVPLMLFASVFGYIAQSGVLLLIKHFGATAAEIVKSCRKVTTILISFMVYGKPWNGYHVAGTLLFVNSVAVERFNSGASSKRFATLLFSMAGLVAVLLVFGGVGPSTFSVVIDAGSAGTRVNVFRFDAWNLKLLDINGAAQVFVEEEPGVGDLNSSALALQLSRLLGVAMAAVPIGQRQVTPLALRATRALEDLSSRQVDDLLDQMKSHIAAAGFKDAGIQPMGGSEEAIAVVQERSQPHEVDSGDEKRVSFTRAVWPLWHFRIAPLLEDLFRMLSAELQRITWHFQSHSPTL